MVTEGQAQWLSPSLPAPKGLSVSEGTGRYTTLKTPTPTPNNPDAELKPNMAVRCCKAILRKDFKKDPQINMIFEEICSEFYLLVVTENIFLDSDAYKKKISQLIHHPFHPSNSHPFET